MQIAYPDTMPPITISVGKVDSAQFSSSTSDRQVTRKRSLSDPSSVSKQALKAIFFPLSQIAGPEFHLVLWVSCVNPVPSRAQEIGDYLQSKAKMNTIKYEINSIKNSPSLPKLVLLPFFRDAGARLEKELDRISSSKETERRKSKLYEALKEILERLKLLDNISKA
jgi:hypothetical protein